MSDLDHSQGPEKKTRVAIFASGGGSNARSIIRYCQEIECSYEVSMIVTNKANAGVINVAKAHDKEYTVINRNQLYHSEEVLDLLVHLKTDIIVLAGFLWLIPHNLIEAFDQRIVNIHPSLLPKYGGKGMYGHHVHDAVKLNGEVRSGMTIHFVNGQYDDGSIILQAACSISRDASSTDIAHQVLDLEHFFYPRVIDGLASRIA